MCVLFFFNATAPTEIYTLSLHDALPISACSPAEVRRNRFVADHCEGFVQAHDELPLLGSKPAQCNSPLFRDRKSTRLNSSHANISYAVFCLKKKTTKTRTSDLHGKQQSA